MWRCNRCNARNRNEDSHCKVCGLKRSLEYHNIL